MTVRPLVPIHIGTLALATGLLGPLHLTRTVDAQNHVADVAAPCSTGGTRLMMGIPDLNIAADPSQALPIASLSYGASNPQQGPSGHPAKPSLSSVSVQMPWSAQELALFTDLTTSTSLTKVVILYTTAGKGPATVCRSLTLVTVGVRGRALQSRSRSTSAKSHSRPWRTMRFRTRHPMAR